MPGFLGAYPRQVALVTVRAMHNFMGKEEEKDNIITIDWHMPVSFEPQLYAIAIGKERFTHNLIRKAGSFVVNFMPEVLKEKILFCGRNSGEAIDKFKQADFGKKEASTIDCPIIRQAVAYLECQVLKEIDAGDHTIFIGTVLKSKELKKGKRLFHIEGDTFTTTV